MENLFRTAVSLALLLPNLLFAGDGQLDGLPAFIDKGMNEWHVPGMAVAVVTDKAVVFEQGFGQTAIKDGLPIDAHTQFAIASTTKAMVTASIMMLVDENKLALDDLVIKHLPKLHFGQASLTQAITIRDLMTHRTGLPLTDFWTFSQNMPLNEQILRLQQVQPTASLRSRFQYQNTMFELLGLIIEKRSGLVWQEFVKSRLWQPLGMHETYASRGRIADNKVHVSPYLYVNETLKQADWDFDADLANAAGSAWSSISDMGRWAQFLLRGGVTESGDRLISEDSFAELFKPQMLIAAADFYPTTALTKPHWMSYGLGWFQQDFQGRKIDFHTGSLSGLIALIGLDRDNNKAVIILGNRDHAEMRHAILWRVMDQPAADTRRDWNGEILALYKGLAEQQKDRWQNTLNTRLKESSLSLAQENYTGTYRNAAWGDVSVSKSGKNLVLNSATMSLALSHWHLDTFLAENNDQDFRFLIPFSINQQAEVHSLMLFGQSFDKIADVSE